MKRPRKDGGDSRKGAFHTAEIKFSTGEAGRLERLFVKATGEASGLIKPWKGFLSAGV